MKINYSGVFPAGAKKFMQDYSLDLQMFETNIQEKLLCQFH